jgi:hypothetical protein
MQGLTVSAVETALQQGFSQHYRLYAEPLSDDEVALAQTLLRERQVGLSPQAEP